MARLLNKINKIYLKPANSLAMKKLSVAALLLIFFFACRRDKIEPVIPGILGTWKIDRTVEEEYQPINTLVYRDEYIGEPGDSVVIKANGILYEYEEGDTEGEEVGYKVVNDSTIDIDDEEYKIRKLTDSSFYFHQEEIDQNERWIYQIYLKK
jgi:hypothetical protein